MADDQESPELDRTLGLEIVRVTEATAIAAARLRGRGDEAAADSAAIAAMYRELARLPLHGVIVVGEGEESEAPLLYIGETVGAGRRPGLRSISPSIRSKARRLPPRRCPTRSRSSPSPSAAACLRCRRLYGQDRHRTRLRRGSRRSRCLAADNLNALAKAKGVPVTEITACILDRPRHAKLIEQVRAAGAAVRLIGDGDIAGVIHTTEPQDTGIDIYMGVGGAPEGVLAAAALCCIGGQIQGRLIATNAASARARPRRRHRRHRPQIHDARHGLRRCDALPRPASPTARCSKACGSPATPSSPTPW